VGPFISAPNKKTPQLNGKTNKSAAISRSEVPGNYSSSDGCSEPVGCGRLTNKRKTNKKENKEGI
jgi:hypothetical protein